MKKISYLMIYATFFLLLSTIVTSVSALFPFSNAWVPLIIAFAILIINTVLSIIFRETIKKKLYFFSALNSIALSFSIRAWYIFRGINNSFWGLLFVILACLAVMFLFYAISFIPFVDKHYSVFFWILSAVLLILYIVSLLLLHNTYISTFGYFLIFIWALVICMCGDSYGRGFYTHVLIASFSIWFVAIIILLFMLDGDSFDFDFLNFSSDSPRKSRINDSF